jgi:transcriptional regulator with XRE-family HTH domain
MNGRQENAARLNFAQEMRRHRLEQGLSQESLAEKTGLHRTYIGSVERGERNICIDNMQRIAEALGVELVALLTRTEQ